jgi:hypothetical protein
MCLINEAMCHLLQLLVREADKQTWEYARYIYTGIYKLNLFDGRTFGTIIRYLL